jgi:tRNA modification GTPase
MPYDQDDTIVALATAPGRAGIAIVRLSGPEAWSVGAKIAGLTSAPRSLAGTFRHVRFRARGGEVTDDGIILFFAAPRSYTGEDVIELQCHGGGIPSRLLLEAAVAAGARPAEPGEFTKRAFLNGKIDLARAEAVMDLVAARTERAATAARAQMDGRLSDAVNAAFDSLVDIQASVEHLLDFDEDEIPSTFCEDSAQALLELEKQLDHLASNWHAGHLLREGALAVISGLPNAGKSSLLNALLGRKRAIVSDIPGTTRDSIEESFDVDGIPVRLVDTAGLRSGAADAIEAEGVARSEALIRDADLHLRVVDASATLPPEEARAIAALPPDRTIVVLNKCDLVETGNGERGTGNGECSQVFTNLKCSQISNLNSGTPTNKPTNEQTNKRINYQTVKPSNCQTVKLSARTGANLAALTSLMAKLLSSDEAAASAPEISERHKTEIGTARNAVAAARECFAQGGEGLVLAAQRLAEGAEALGRVTGRVWSEELLDAIFGKFCVGK